MLKRKKLLYSEFSYEPRMIDFKHIRINFVIRKFVQIS